MLEEHRNSEVCPVLVMVFDSLLRFDRLASQFELA